MKGIEAINAIIILVLGVLTLLAILGLFMGVWTPAKGGTSLQAATSVTCQKINPAFCADTSQNRALQARMPVDDFDADGDGKINERKENIPPDSWATCGHTTCPGGDTDDNLEELCYHYYGCRAGLSDETAWLEWRECCVVKVCGCPRT
jgi:hypothetical protein